MLSTLLYFFLALLLLIIVHELGHFWVARLCGIKVLRFSFGFGKVLARWKDKKGTEYVWSLFPLGGYVKMLDENEGKVPNRERHLAFNNKPLAARMAVIVAGPLFNFLFAILAFWLALMVGIKSLAPLVEEVRPGGIAQAAGLEAKQEILFLDNKKIDSWRDLQYALMPLVGSDDSVVLTVKSLTTGKKKTISLPLSQWKLDAQKPDLLDSLGIVPFIPKIPPVVADVMDNSPAQQAGIKANDRIKSINNKPLSDWLILVEYVKSHPNALLNLDIERDGKNERIAVKLGSKEIEGQTQGFLGLRSQKFDWPAKWLRVQRLGPIEAFTTACWQTAEITRATFTLLGRLASGKLALKTISGPVGIAQGAGESGRSGLSYYLSFLALVSISLGVLNLLPIPLLDGGHLLFCFFELIRRKPLSEEAKSIGVYLGLVLLIGLMILALSNDIARLTTG